jgi:hypothetical protein
MNYYKKYLKYKKKYLFFKNQYGGAKVGDIIYKLVEPGKNNLMGKITGENNVGILDSEGVHTGPIWIYWNTTTLKEGYLKKKNENKVWAVASSIEGLGQPKSGKSGYDPFILDSVPSVPARVQPSSAAQVSPSGSSSLLKTLSKLWERTPTSEEPVAIASSAAVASPKSKFMYLVDFWQDFPSTEYGGIIIVIAESNSECFQILQSSFRDREQDTPTKIAEAVRRASSFEIKNAETSRIVRSFLT